MNPTSPTELDVPTIMRIGAARMTAGLDRMTRLDLEAHARVFGPLPRMSADELVQAATQVDLRGQGGAAFPFARKLQAVINAAKKAGEAPIVVVNATEGEPGSFKDKMLMIRSPYLILSGAALVAEAIGADEIIIGVTSNELANRSMEAAIAAEPGLRKIARVFQQPERFISGESGALIRGINGKKPLPPGRKQLAAEKGVDDVPTLLSNASTFAQVSVLALLGPQRFASVGVPEEPGTVLLSVSGSARRPAVVECPTGVPLGHVLDICQAPAGDGVLVGGYHGMWLDAEVAYQVPVGREGLAAAGGTFGSGIVLPLGDGTCPLGEVARIASYLAGESAGQCGPCKLGLPTIARAMNAIVDGSGGIEALDVARRGAAAANKRGACSHPDGTTRMVLSALEVFTEDLAAHVFHSSCGRPVRGVLPLPAGPEAENDKQLMVDWVRCEGHGLCAHLVPELIHLDGNGFPVVMNIPVPPWLEKDAQQAVEMCPALALRLAVDPKKKGSGGPSPAPVAAPALRPGLLGGSARPELTGGSDVGWQIGPGTGPRAIGPS
ncbi:MAG TPA: NADH-ubiquinone oxidoreductase-F iron-sulfur binding region domain-containing protein [Trebonia sp.]|nr:NADH-ubiquinone oxidoreductase-F iron-sulfur binding region domain-containing protein [Trebonia sp.]